MVGDRHADHAGANDDGVVDCGHARRASRARVFICAFCKTNAWKMRATMAARIEPGAARTPPRTMHEQRAQDDRVRLRER